MFAIQLIIKLKRNIMKTTLLFSALFLFSSAIFSQTSVKNSSTIRDNANLQKNKSGTQVNNTGDASSGTSIQSNAVYNAKTKTYAEVEKEKKASAATKNKIKGQAKESNKVASQDANVSASAHSNTSINASAKDNKINNNTSLNKSVTVSSSQAKNSAHQIKDERKAVVINKNDAKMEKGHHVATGVNPSAIKAEKKARATSSTAVQREATSVTTVKPRPVSIKASTLVKTNGGIKLR